VNSWLNWFVWSFTSARQADFIRGMMLERALFANLDTWVIAVGDSACSMKNIINERINFEIAIATRRS
jgi:hypothetical protein